MYSLPVYENAACSAPFLSFKIGTSCHCLDSLKIHTDILAEHMGYSFVIVFFFFA
jgi:hypothetical protein